MKIIICIGLISGFMGAMASNFKKPEDIRISVNKGHGNNTLTIDKQLQDLEFPSYESDSQFIEGALLNIPFFEGKSKEHIGEYMQAIKDKSPLKYGQIMGMIERQKNIKKSPQQIDEKDLTSIDQRIQYALLEVALENQKAGDQNRVDDLAQAGKDRRRTCCTFITSIAATILLAVPALTLSIINVYKAFH